MVAISVIVIAVVAAMYPMYPALFNAIGQFGVAFGYWFGPGPPDF
jgi:hypothetical protein